MFNPPPQGPSWADHPRTISFPSLVFALPWAKISRRSQHPALRYPQPYKQTKKNSKLNITLLYGEIKTLKNITNKRANIRSKYKFFLLCCRSAVDSHFLCQGLRSSHLAEWVIRVDALRQPSNAVHQRGAVWEWDFTRVKCCRHPPAERCLGSLWVWVMSSARRGTRCLVYRRKSLRRVRYIRQRRACAGANLHPVVVSDRRADRAFVAVTPVTGWGGGATGQCGQAAAQRPCSSTRTQMDVIADKYDAVGDQLYHIQ